MAEPLPFDEHAERLKIRSSPRPATRINRKVIMVISGIGALGLFTAMSVALQPPKATTSAERRELYNTVNTRKPEGLSALPASYSDTRPAPNIPLGPPLSGDLGSTMLAAERELGLEPQYQRRLEQDFRPNPAEEAARARRMREAALAEEAATASVFFQLQSSARTISATSNETKGGGNDKDVAAELMALAMQGSGGFGPLSASPDPNLQSRKTTFANQLSDGEFYNPNRLQNPVSPYQVMAGTLIPASLITGINSDLPGSIIAQVTQPVYDTVTGTHILIPQGARMIGRYQSEVSFGQDRALVIWERLIFPDGSSIQISEPGADSQGYSGLSDRTDHHWDRVFAAAGLATVLGIGSEIGNESDDDIERAIRRGVSDTINQAGQRVVDRTLSIQPTIRVRPGWPVRVIVTRDLVLRPANRS